MELSYYPEYRKKNIIKLPKPLRDAERVLRKIISSEEYLAERDRLEKEDEKAFDQIVYDFTISPSDKLDFIQRTGDRPSTHDRVITNLRERNDFYDMVDKLFEEEWLKRRLFPSNGPTAAELRNFRKDFEYYISSCHDFDPVQA